MNNRIDELEKEIKLVKELIKLRAELEGVKVTNGGTIINSFPSYPLAGQILCGSTQTTGYVKATDTTYAGLKYGGSKIKNEWPPSKDMWATATMDHYVEGRGPCECEYK